MEKVIKQFAFKATELAENRIRGAAAVMGNLDRGGDVIFPGAFKKALKPFLEAGFVPDSHNWWSVGQMIAMPVSAKETGNELICEAEFHTTEKAQEVRLVCQERLAKGLPVGLSIGFSLKAEGRQWFDNGQKLLDYAKENEYDLELFDQKGIRACKEQCRGIVEVEELYEWSIVTVPMNPKARATAVKREGEGPQEICLDLGSLNELSFEDHSDAVLSAVKGYLERCEDYLATRTKGGFGLSDQRRAEFTAIHAALGQVLAAAPPAPLAKQVLQLQRESLELDAPVLQLG